MNAVAKATGLSATLAAVGSAPTSVQLVTIVAVGVVIARPNLYPRRDAVMPTGEGKPAFERVPDRSDTRFSQS